jgi:flagellar protein FlbD
VIKVTRINGTAMVLNAELIEVVEETPDTVISLTTGHKYVVHEAAEEIVDRSIEYRRQCAQRARDATTRLE